MEATTASALEVSGGLTTATKWVFPEVAQLSRKEKRKQIKKWRRKQMRQQAAAEEKADENGGLEDTVDKQRIQLEEQAEAEVLAKEKANHDDQERLWIEREKQAMEDFQRRQEERKKLEAERKVDETEEDSFVDGDGPAEIIWKGNEIIVRKRRVKAVEPPASTNLKNSNKAASNPLPPQSSAFAAHNKHLPPPFAEEQSRTFGTEQDKTHCPFHIKTGVCRFGVRCSRVHVYPDQSFTLLIRNMYTGPGLTWEHDEGLEHSDEEVAQHYEEFFEDVHSEFLQYGELVNFKVCKNGSSHLRGNVYVHYKTEASALAAYNATNGRFYAGKQITCEFVGVTRWRVALCGEYMKSHHKPCSRGTACNFLHCFRNPNGEYDWADWEYPPPRYWAAKMAKLSGYDSSLKRENDESDEDSERHYGSPGRLRQRDTRGHKEFRSKNRHRISVRNDDDRTARHGSYGRHEGHGHRHRSDSDDETGTSSRHRASRKRHRNRHDTRHRSDSDDASERTSGHKERRGSRLRSDRYCPDSDDSIDRSSRQRARGRQEMQDDYGANAEDSLAGQPRHRHKDARESSSFKEVDERGEINCNDTTRSSHGIDKDLDSRSRERHRSKSRRRSSNDSRHHSTNSIQDSMYGERHRKAFDYGQSPDLKQSRHTKHTGWGDERDGQLTVDGSYKHGRVSHTMMGGQIEDGVSSDAEIGRSHEMRKDRHDGRRKDKKRKRSEISRNQISANEGEESRSLDPEDRWGVGGDS